jgi:hypothetical protein
MNLPSSEKTGSIRREIVDISNSSLNDETDQECQMQISENVARMNDPLPALQDRENHGQFGHFAYVGNPHSPL